MERAWSYLQKELRATPGRGNYTLRMTISCAILIALFMSLQIPFLAIALIVVFYVSQPNVVMISLVSVAFFLVVTLVLGGVLLIIKWTYDYPLVRLVASVLLFALAVYLMRIMGKLGLAFFVVALTVIYAQTFPSMTGQSEILVRLLLWLWVAINSAIVVTLLVNACFAQAFPGWQFKSALAAMLRQTASCLTQTDADFLEQTRPTFSTIARQVAQLHTLFKLARLSSTEIADNLQKWQSVMAFTLRSYQLIALLQPGADDAARRPLADALFALAQQVEEGKLPPVQAASLSVEHEQDVIVREVAALMTSLLRDEEVALPPGEGEKIALMPPDAWHNPAYLHFTLKTVLATLICYLFYTATDWQGIHTIMLSCVIVAQPGLGATMQKIALRIGGALLATLLALLLIIFIQPWTESLVGLLAMALPVMALAAWLAGGSERIAYAGIQLGFTFALAFLSWFGPLTNLTELRDRVIGILLGVLVSSLIHLYLWPDSEAPQLKASLARLYRRIAGLMRATDRESTTPALFASLTESDALLNRVAAEPLNTWAHPHAEAKDWPRGETFASAQELVRLSEGYRLYAAADDPFLSRCAGYVEAYAAAIDQAQPKPPLTVLHADTANPYGPPLMQALSSLPAWPSPSSLNSPQAE